MDDGYDSPDSDGHASIPSPTETSFNHNTLPRLRNWPPSPSPECGESEDEGDSKSPLVVFRPRLAGFQQHMADRSSPHSGSRIPRPSAIKTFNSDPPRTPRKPSREPQKRNTEDTDPSLLEGVPDDSKAAEGSSKIIETSDDRSLLAQRVRDLHLDDQTPDESYDLPMTDRSASSTPDAETGLSRRIGVRKHRKAMPAAWMMSAPGSSATPTVDPPGPRADQLTSDSVPSGSEPTPPEYTPDVAEHSGYRLFLNGAALRRVSAKTTNNLDIQNETIEEIDASTIMNMKFPRPDCKEPQRLPSPLQHSGPQSSADLHQSDALKVTEVTTSGSENAESSPPAPNDHQETSGLIQDGAFAGTLGSNTLESTLTAGSLTHPSPPPKASNQWVSGAPTQSVAGTSSALPINNNSHVASSRAPRTPPGRDMRVQSPLSAEILATVEGAKSGQGPTEVGGSSEPQYPYQGFNLWKFKKSKSARRMSMNTPPSHSSMSTTATEFLRRDPPSPLESEYKFSGQIVGFGDGMRTSASARYSLAAADPFIDSERVSGTVPPPNSTANTPSAAVGVRPFVALADKAKPRERSRSDPLDSKVVEFARPGDQRQLFTPNRIWKVEQNVARPQSSLSSIQPAVSRAKAPDKGSAQGGLGGDQKLRRHEEPGQEKMWSSQRSVGLLDQPALTNSSDSFGNSSRLWSGPSNNFHLTQNRHEAKSTSVENISQSHCSTDSLELDEVEVRVQTPGSISNEPTAMGPEREKIMLLRRQILEIEGLLEVSRRADRPGQPRTRSTDELIEKLSEYQTEYRHLTQTASYNALEKTLHGSDPSTLSTIQGHGSPARQIAELQAKVEGLERSAKEETDARRREKDENDQTILHLRAALDQKLGFSGAGEHLHHRIMELERQLRQARQAHQEDVAAREAKFTQILTERDAEVNHLQGELDELANIMPVEHPSEFIFQEEDDSWVEEKSREMSQLFDESLDQIITEIHGVPQGEEYDEAAAEAEVSLRQMAADAGFGQSMNKAALAAFGIRQLREENNMLRDEYCQSEERVKELMQTDEELGQEVSTLKERMHQLDIHNSALQKSIAGSETTIEVMRIRVEELQKHLFEKSNALEKAMAETQKLNGLNDRIQAIEVEKATLERSCSEFRISVEKWKAYSSRAEDRVRENKAELVHLKGRVQKSEDTASGLRAEVDAYKQRNSELLRTIETIDNKKTEQLMASEQQIADLKASNASLIKERDTVKESAKDVDRRIGEVNSTVRTLQEKLSTASDLVSKLEGEKGSLEQSYQKAEMDAKQARSRFNVLLHESAEKETIWNNVKVSLQEQIERATSDSRHLVGPYENALIHIAAEMKAIIPQDEMDEGILEAVKEGLASVADAEGERLELAKLEIVATVVCGIKTLEGWIDNVDQRRSELEEKNERLKAAIKKWGTENSKEKSKVDALKKETKDLALKLKAEKKQSDEKIGQLILALRR